VNHKNGLDTGSNLSLNRSTALLQLCYRKHSSLPQLTPLARRAADLRRSAPGGATAEAPHRR